MSRTHTQVTYNRLNHLPTPDELKYRQGPATVVSSQTTPAGVNIIDSFVEVENRTGLTVISQTVSNPSDGKLQIHSQLYTKQVRNRWTGEIIGTYDMVYEWTKRSITYLTRDTLIVDGTTYGLNPAVGGIAGRPSDTSDGTGPVNRSSTIHFPFDVEIYDPNNAGDMLGPNIDYTITFVTWDGTIISTQLVKPGGTAVPPAPPVRPGNTFVGWSEDLGNIQRDMTVRPIYSNDTLSVTWANWDGTILKTELVVFGQSATPPTVPSRTGHTFTGWDTDYTFISNTVTITAVFSPNMMTVTFIDWDDYPLNVQQVPYGSAPTMILDPIRAHYIFTGWDHDLTSITSNLIVRATYEIQKFMVTYIDTLNNGVLRTEEVPYGSAVTPPAWPWYQELDATFYEAYEFVGWSGNLVNIQDHTTIYGIFRMKMITVTVVDDSNGDIIKRYSVPYDSSFTPFMPPDHTDIGLDFDGWEGNGGATLVYMKQDTIVYAKYTQLWLTVTYLTENGAQTMPPTIYWEDRIRYGNSVRMENLIPLSMVSGGKKLKNWYYINKDTDRLEVFDGDTRVYYDIICYPRF